MCLNRNIKQIPKKLIENLIISFLFLSTSFSNRLNDVLNCIFVIGSEIYVFHYF